MFMSNFKQQLNQQLGKTENGALGYFTAGNSFVDFNFRIPSYRTDSGQLWSDFLEMYRDDEILAMKMMFFLRDIRGGIGERNSFRLLLKSMAYVNLDFVTKLIPLVPEYGRWDDLFVLLATPVEYSMLQFVSAQLVEDIENMNTNKPISLLAKWMPSINASSKATIAKAKRIIAAFGMSEANYRRMLSDLRAYLNVVEKNLSAKELDKIDYAKVPSQAHLRYKHTFGIKDTERYLTYLEALVKNEVKINAGTLAPYQIWSKYSEAWYRVGPYDETLEQLWKNLPDTGSLSSTLVVADGSGSMNTTIGKSSVTALDVAQSLAVYFGEKCQGEFKNQFITFSKSPQLVHFGSGSLKSKIEITKRYAEVSNTNIEKVFELVLQTAVTNKMSQAELPETILIISDMEFDAAASSGSSWDRGYYGTPDKALFDGLADKFVEHGYKMPRLVFWNVNSRSGIIPMQENEAGVILVSGFNQNAVRMVMTGELDPFLAIKAVLDSERYKAVELALQ